MRRNDIPMLLTAALVFADATIVTLALPNLLVDLNTSVYGVAAVLAVYTAVLGCTALVAPRLLRAGSYAWTGAGARSEERRVGKECRSRWSPYH